MIPPLDEQYEPIAEVPVDVTTLSHPLTVPFSPTPSGATVRRTDRGWLITHE